MRLAIKIRRVNTQNRLLMITHLQLLDQGCIPPLYKLHMRIYLQVELLTTKVLLHAATSIVSILSLCVRHYVHCHILVVKILKLLESLLVLGLGEVVLQEDVDVETFLV